MVKSLYSYLTAPFDWNMNYRFDYLISNKNTPLVLFTTVYCVWLSYYRQTLSGGGETPSGNDGLEHSVFLI